MAMSGMTIGHLTTRIAIDQRSVTKGASGGRQTTWAPRGNAWARKRELGGGVQAASTGGGGEVAQARTEFVVAYRPWLQADAMRVRAGAATYEITHVAHWSNQWTVLTCNTGVLNGQD